ncbi:hypothetical protein NliqN6_5603 [Naganishia liquefaciens]|uniref:DUF155 domain-containing protein n=1 Tax=Naganishia liquefaciens TaxID=104408 RepID=A0A8H3YJ53_9TREE|nr:hypothetical protein NliqN6_5603 [Naganishia liquefaciens]
MFRKALSGRAVQGHAQVGLLSQHGFHPTQRIATSVASPIVPYQYAQTWRCASSSAKSLASIQAGSGTRHNTSIPKHSQLGKRTSSGTGAASSSAAQADPTRNATPKSTKRRQVIASQDLRSNPPPTRGPLLQCIAYSTAEKYDLDKLAVQLRGLDVKWSTVLEEASNTGALGVPGISASADQAIVISDWNTTNVLEDNTYEERDQFGLASDLLTAEENGYESNTTAHRHRALASFDQGQNGEIWVFRNGSFVTWGLTPAEGRRFLREVIRNPATIVEVGTLNFGRVQTEEVDFVVDPTEETRIKGNLILLGRAPELQTFTPSPTYAALLTRYTLSLSLARSSALSAVEAKLDAHLASVSKVPHMLEVWGRQPLGRKEVIRKIGELMVLREAVNFRGGGLEDTPEIYWSEPQLEEYFDTISREFEMKERIDTINQKIDYASEVQSTLRALLTEASGHRMELIIIVLIAVEVVFLLLREGHELSHKIGDLLQSLLTPIKAVDGTSNMQEEGAAEELRKSEVEAPVLGGSSRESRLV